MGYRTSQVPRAELLIRSLGVPSLLQAIQKPDIKPIMGVTDEKGDMVFSHQEAGKIISNLSQHHIAYQLERCTVSDIPRITVSRKVDDGAGGTKMLVKDFGKLSLGQQQSIVLSLMLLSDR